VLDQIVLCKACGFVNYIEGVNHVKYSKLRTKAEKQTTDAVRASIAKSSAKPAQMAAVSRRRVELCFSL